MRRLMDVEIGGLSIHAISYNTCVKVTLLSTNIELFEGYIFDPILSYFSFNSLHPLWEAPKLMTKVH